MDYEKQMFVDGEVLTAEQLNRIEDALARIAASTSNPNLLDNWYFADPINQRGQTEYSGGIYGIDRWVGGHSTTKVVVKDGFVEVSTSASWYGIMQYIENPQRFAGKKVTLSAFTRSLKNGRAFLRLFVNGSNLTHAEISGAGVTSVTATLPETVTEIRPIFYLENSAIELYAVKLELGSEQTLAHQDENGVWVLNDTPPNKQQELAKCQRYFVGYKKNGWTMAYVSFSSYLMIEMPLTVPLRSSDIVLARSAEAPLSIYGPNGWQDISSLGFSTQYTGGSLYLQCAKSVWEQLVNLTAGMSYLVRGLPDVSVDL